MAAPNRRGHRLTRRGQKAAQRRLRRMQQAAFKAAPRLAGTNVAAGRLVQRGPHRVDRTKEVWRKLRWMLQRRSR